MSCSTCVLQTYEDRRSVEVLKIQNAARNSTEWFENVERYSGMEIEQFAYSLLTRSQRISHENLRLRERAWLEGYERWLAASSQCRPPTCRQPPCRRCCCRCTVRGLTLKNRIVVSPMATYSAVDGVPQDFHLVHLGARALGGAALVFVEMTSPTPEGRITPGCPGLWNDAQQAALQAHRRFRAWPEPAHASACSSATAGPRARPRSAGNTPTNRCADRQLAAAGRQRGALTASRTSCRRR